MAYICWALLLVLWIQGCLACLVTDCPEGGKRSGFHTLRQCQSCGPDGSGQCVGTSICCGESFGCYIGTPETLICEKENELSSPCRPQGENCQTLEDGQCFANSLCCNSRGCVEDISCANLSIRTTSEERSSLSGNGFKRNIQDRLKSKLLEVLLRQP